MQMKKKIIILSKDLKILKDQILHDSTATTVIYDWMLYKAQYLLDIRRVEYYFESLLSI